MRYIVILDSPLLFQQLQELTRAATEVICLANESAPFKRPFPKQIKILREDPFKDDTYKKLALNPDDRIIIHASKPDTAEKILSTIHKMSDSVPIVVLGNNITGSPATFPDNISYLSINELLEENVTNEWANISNRQRTSAIRTLTRDAENILLLIQHLSLIHI